MDPTLKRMLERDAKLKEQLDNSWQTEIDLNGARPEQVGLVPVFADKLCRLWIYKDDRSEEMLMIFDPNWLHHAKRWSGPRLDKRRLPEEKT